MLPSRAGEALSNEGGRPFDIPNDTLDPPESCFDQLYEGHRQGVHAYFLGRTSDDEVALELLQETFLRAWRQIDKLQKMVADQQRYWLFSVAKNLLTDYYRKQSVRSTAQAQLDNQPAQHIPTAQEPVAQWEAQESIALLDRAIQRLPENLRTVLLMQVLGEMNSKQIGEMLEKPAGTIRYQISVARKQLAREIQLIEGEGSL